MEELFAERVVKVERPKHHYKYLESETGSYLSIVGNSAELIQHVDDSAIWDEVAGAIEHVATGVRVSLDSETGTIQPHAASEIAGLEGLVQTLKFKLAHGPEFLPSEYLATFKQQGWVCLTSIIPPKVLEGLEWVACTDRYAGRIGERTYAICQHPAVAETAAEPVSLWLIRQYMQIEDVRLSHAPAMAVLRKDDGERNVQGWHSDFPYHWGTGIKGSIPTPSGQTVMGVQRNVCVSEFKKERGATAFKLGSHARDEGPPNEWGTARIHARPGYRKEKGLPYNGPDADIVEAPGGSIILYDSRTWHRAGVNRTDKPRAAMLQAMTPIYVFPKNDTSVAYRMFRESDVFNQVNERVKTEVQNLMVHKFIGPGGEYAISPDEEFTKELRGDAQESGGY